MKAFLLFLLLFPLCAVAQHSVEQGRKLYEQKKYSEAVAALKAVKEDQPDFAAARYYLGRVAFDQKEFDDAADYFEEATEARNGNVADYYSWLGDSYGTIARDANVLRQGMLAPKMKAAWEKAIALDAKNLSARFSLIEFYSKAPGFMGGSMDKAKEVARQIIALQPAAGHRQLGNLYLKEENIASAEKEFVEMARVEPALMPILGNFYVGQKQYEKAFALFDEQLKANPQDMLAAYQLGKTSAVSGLRLNDGEQALLKYLAYTPKANEPSHAGANMRLAQIYEKKGNTAEAKVKYETAIRLDNNLQEAKDGLTRVSRKL
jgi:tetratricopeptide (TPR) repeat protein